VSTTHVLIGITAAFAWARLVMVGFGGVESQLRSVAEQERAGDRVVFHEPVAHDEVVNLVAGADIGLAPYLPVG
jgi:glycosyltransferase involved in cell wall biosynthesis